MMAAHLNGSRKGLVCGVVVLWCYDLFVAICVF